MPFNRSLFSSATDNWETPKKLFDALDREFTFTLDVCASADNCKCERHFTKETNGLKQAWAGETCWMNPPYGDQLPRWVRKACLEAQQSQTTVVSLLPARTDTNWFHRFIFEDAMEIHFLRGRLRFNDAKNGAPFPSIITVHSTVEEMRGKVAMALGGKSRQRSLF